VVLYFTYKVTEFLVEAGPQTKRTDNIHHVVFIKGKARNLAKSNPIELKKLILKEIGEIDRIYLSGQEHLKIYCKNDAQTINALSLTMLNSMEVVATEPITQFTKIAKTSHTDVIRYTTEDITGVSEELTVKDIVEEISANKAVSMTKIKEGRRQKTTAVLLSFDSDTLPDHLSNEYIRYKVKQFNAVPVRCFTANHTAMSLLSVGPLIQRALHVQAGTNTRHAPN